MSLVALITALALAPQTMPQVAGRVDPASAEGQAVLAPVNAVFAALTTRDGAAILAQADPAGRLTIVVENPDGTRTVDTPRWTEFAGSFVPGPERLEETLADPLVAIDGDIALVWSRYVFKIDGKVAHCGVDHLDLVRTDGAWKIVNVTWTQRTTGCA